jgi:hypothetical protein
LALAFSNLVSHILSLSLFVCWPWDCLRASVMTCLVMACATFLYSAITCCSGRPAFALANLGPICLHYECYLANTTTQMHLSGVGIICLPHLVVGSTPDWSGGSTYSVHLALSISIAIKKPSLASCNVSSNIQ